MPIQGTSHIGEARRMVMRLADTHGFGEVQSGKLALVATELATNIARHTRGGDLVLQALDFEDRVMIEVLALDGGPGMADPVRCLRDGYSTRGTSGTGLGAVRRQSDEFDLYSDPEKGSAVLSRIADRPTGSLQHGVARFGAVALPHPKETVAGDVWQLCQSPKGQLLVMVTDGIGHGLPAADAANAADGIFGDSAYFSPESFLGAADRELRATRGAAAACALLDPTHGRLRFAGVGNIAGCVINGGTSQGLMSHYGTLGQGPSKIQELEYALTPGSLVLLHSDGLKSRWNLSAYPGLFQAHPALIAGILWRDFDRGNDDSTVVVIDARMESC